MFKKIMLITIPVVIIGAVLFFALSGSAKKEGAFKTVPCERGSIIDKALAVGTIVPRHEIAVKSKISGIVKKLYVDIGDRVKLGDPLMDIAPDPTPLEYAEANSQLDLAQVAFDNATREMDRAKTLKEKNLISDQEFENVKGKYDEAQLRVKRSKENLALIGKGQTKIADQVVENVIKSPVDGTVLARHVNIGDPVVPLTSYQAGTELLGLADMSDLVFKGTVDEIDVGKLKVGMQVELKVGALPKDKVLGTLSKISPKAHKEEGSTVFDVEINLADASATTLRAGYSANADIIITKKENILLIPERLITFAGDTAYIEIQDSIGTIAKKKIETGLSDGINIEVTNGLDSGRAVVERPPKEIKGVME
jgi:HlyD family secretion protein